MLAKFDKPSPNELREMQVDALSALEDICEQVMNSMRPYGIDRLGYYFRDKRGNIIPEQKKTMQKMMRILSICVKICWLMWNIRTFRRIKKPSVVRNTPFLKRWSGSITLLMVNGRRCRFVVAVFVNIWLLPVQLPHYGGWHRDSWY